MTTVDIKRLRRAKLGAIAFAIVMILFGLIVILGSSGKPTGIIVGIIWILIFGGIPLEIARRVSKKVPPEDDVNFIASDNRNLPIGNFYWINNKGIWKNNMLWIKWDEVKDVNVVRTWVETAHKTRTFTLLDLWTMSGPDAMNFGIIRVITKDGKSYEINNVVDPNNLVDYIKNVYLKK